MVGSARRSRHVVDWDGLPLSAAARTEGPRVRCRDASSVSVGAATNPSRLGTRNWRPEHQQFFTHDNATCSNRPTIERLQFMKVCCSPQMRTRLSRSDVCHGGLSQIAKPAAGRGTCPWRVPRAHQADPGQVRRCEKPVRLTQRSPDSYGQRLRAPPGRANPCMNGSVVRC